MDPRGSRRAGVPDVIDGVGVDADTDRPQVDNDGSDVPWAGVGVVVVALVAGAFVTGWHFGRRWGRLMGW